MHQLKTDQFFETSSSPLPHGRNFLDLPYEVRCRVYRLAGVVRKCPILLSWDPPEYRSCRNFYYEKTMRCLAAFTFDFDCDCDQHPHHRYDRRLPVSLLCCSRDVSQEVLSLFYATNRFYIRYTGPGSFDAMVNLRPTTVAMIKYLHVVLHQSSKDISIGFCNCEKDERPLQCMPTRYYQGLISGWKAACARLEQSIQQSQLEMCLICDTDDRQVVTEVLDPLRRVPFLAAFSVRFCQPIIPWRIVDQSLHGDLRQLAQQTTLQITRHSDSSNRQTFRYDLLPSELQIRILEHTELVAPDGHLAWSHSQGLLEISEYNAYSIKPRLHCQICDPLRVVCCPPRLPKGGTWVSQCNRCWKFPSSLFLVNRQFYQEATRIFWSVNRFIILSIKAFQADVDFGSMLKPVPLTAVMPPRAMRYLRYLQFNNPQQWETGPGVLKHMVETLRRGADISRLTIVLEFKSYHPIVLLFGQESSTEGRERGDCWELYTPTVTEFSLLNGLKDFFVHVHEFCGLYDCVNNKRSLWERELETMVMGEGYRSLDGVKQDVYVRGF